MNRKKRNLIILSATLLLGIIALLVFKTKNDTTTLKQNYHIEDTASVTKVFMADKMGNTVLLERKENNTWLVDQNYPVAEHAIDMLLNTLNSMRIREPIAIAAHANIIKGLSATSTKVEIYEKKYFIDWFNKLKLFPSEKLTKTIYVGQETQDNQGTYMIMKGDKSPVIVYIPGFRGFLTTRFTAKPYTWRSHEILDLNVAQIQSVKIEIPQKPEESFEILRNGKSFDMKMLSTNTILPKFDTAHVADLLSSFVKINFDKFAIGIPAVERDSIFAKEPVFIITVADTAGNSKWIKTFVKLTDVGSHVSPSDKDEFYEILDVNRMYGIVEGLADTVVLQYYSLDNILKPASYYMK